MRPAQPHSRALYRSAQSALRTAFRAMGLEDICARCPDPCCARFSFRQLLEPADLALLPEHALPTIHNDASPCCHLTPTGCDLPSDGRPWVCVSHLCRRCTVAMKAPQALELNRLFARLDAAYTEMQRARAGNRAG